jgi:hypothetical protein
MSDSMAVGLRMLCVLLVAVGTSTAPLGSLNPILPVKA